MNATPALKSHPTQHALRTRLVADLCLSAMKILRNACGFAALACTVMSAHCAQPSAPVQSDASLHRRMLRDVLDLHPSVQSARSQLNAARSDRQAARWQFFPTPSIGLENSDTKLVTARDARVRFLRIQQPVWTGGRLSAQYSKAQAQQAVSESGMQEQRLSLGLRWLEAWAEVQAAQQRIEAYEESQAEHRKYVEQVRSRALEGVAAASDIELSRSRLAAVMAELAQARAQRQQALNKLQQLWGAVLPDDAILALSQPYSLEPSEMLPATDALVDQVLERHPTLRKSLALEQTLHSDVELARARYSPELYMRHDHLHGDITGSQRQLVFGLSSSYGAGLSMVEGVASAQARLQAQRDDILTRRREITEQVMSETVQLQTQQARVKHLQSALKSAGVFLDSSTRQFAAGRRSWQELMNSAREKAQIRVQLADALSQVWQVSERLKLQSLGADNYLDLP